MKNFIQGLTRIDSWRSTEKNMTASSSVVERLMNTNSTSEASREAVWVFSQYPMIKNGSRSDMDQS